MNPRTGLNKRKKKESKNWAREEEYSRPVITHHPLLFQISHMRIGSGRPIITQIKTQLKPHKISQPTQPKAFVFMSLSLLFI